MTSKSLQSIDIDLLSVVKLKQKILLKFETLFLPENLPEKFLLLLITLQTIS